MQTVPIPLSSLLERLLDLAQFLVVGLVAWQARMMIQTRDDMRTIKQELFGPQGENGLRGDVAELKEHVVEQHSHTTRIADGLNETRRAVKLPEVDYLR